MALEDDLVAVFDAIAEQGKALDAVYSQGVDIVQEAAGLFSDAQELVSEALGGDGPSPDAPSVDENYNDALLRDIFNPYGSIDSAGIRDSTRSLGRQKVARDLQALRTGAQVPRVGGEVVGRSVAGGASAGSGGSDGVDMTLLGAVMNAKNGRGLARNLLDFTPAGWALDLFDLFSGGPEPLQPLTKYAMPEGVAFDVALHEGRMYSGDSDQSGAERAYGPAWGDPAEGAAAVPSDPPALQVFDSAFWSQHSAAIATAVKGEMLQGHSINGVISEDL